MRNILMTTFVDLSGIHFFVAFDEILKSNDCIVRFKCFIILHMIMQDGAHYDKLVSHVNHVLKKMAKINYTNILYADLCEIYLHLLTSKVAFLLKMSFLLPNYQLAGAKTTVPFKTTMAGIQFIAECCDHFNAHSTLVNEGSYLYLYKVLKNVQYNGLNPSVVPANQCQMRALIPTLKDMESIFSLMVKTANRIVERIRYLSDLYAIPILSKRYSFVQSQQDDRKQVSPEPKMGLQRTSNNTLTNPAIYLRDFASSAPSLVPFLISKFKIRKKELPSPNKSLRAETETLIVIPSESTSTEGKNTKSKIPIVMEPILFTDYTKIRELNAKIRILEEKLEDQDQKLKELEGSDFKRKVESVHKINEELRQKLDSEKIKSEERDQYKMKYETLADLYSEMRKQLKMMCETSKQESSTKDLFVANQKLSDEIVSLKTALFSTEERVKEVSQKMEEMKKNTSHVSNGTSICTPKMFKKYLDNHLKVLEDVAIKFNTDQELTKASFIHLLKNSGQQFNYLGFQLCDDPDKMNALCLFLTHAQNYMGQILDNGKQYMKKAYDMGNKLSLIIVEFDNSLKDFNSMFLTFVEEMKANCGNVELDAILVKFASSIESLLNIANNLPEINEYSNEAIEEFDFEQEIKRALEMIKKLIQDSIEFEAEILQDDGLKNNHEKKVFYKKNSSWTKGLAGFVRSLGPSAAHLTESISGFIKGHVLIEELVVSTNNLMALIAQFTVVCRTKARPDSRSLQKLIQDTSMIRKFAQTSVNNAKSSLKIAQAVEIDFSTLSKPKMIALENEIQIHILELEKEIGNERERLGKIRAS
ncbi:hypothetical protein HZS_223, partial [Henneguya salminicola]